MFDRLKRFPNRKIRLGVFLLGALVLSSGFRSPKERFRGEVFPDAGVVTVVYDGDTIGVRFQDGGTRKVRLIGVDAPEMEDEREEVRLFAHTSKRFCFFHLYRKTVRLEYDWEKEDKYGRLLAYVWLGEDLLFNEFLLREGFASAFLKFPFDEKYRQKFAEAERTARQQERGFWQRRPLPLILAGEAVHFVGRFIEVGFQCAGVRFQGNFAFLGAEENFAVLIPRAQFPLFPEIRSFVGQHLSVTGFLEEYKGKPQIVVSLPSQIREAE